MENVTDLMMVLVLYSHSDHGVTDITSYTLHHGVKNMT